MSPSDVIHMETEAVRAMAIRLSQISDVLRNAQSEVQRAADRIDWNGPNREEFMGEIRNWTNSIRPYIETAQFMDRQLRSEEEEWLMAALTLSTGIIVPSHVHPENINSTEPARIEDIESYLQSTPYGQDLLKLFKEYGVTIEFGSISNPDTIASTSLDGKKIIIDIDFANLSDAELAAVLVHEGTHVVQAVDANNTIPILGQLFDGIAYGVYPWDDEYVAFKAEAEFWIAINTDLPPSPQLSSVVKMIFKSDGEYRAVSDACDILHDFAGYNHLLDPSE
jgi:uncharacterized protein YukE